MAQKSLFDKDAEPVLWMQCCDCKCLWTLDEWGCLGFDDDEANELMCPLPSCHNIQAAEWEDAPIPMDIRNNNRAASILFLNRQRVSMGLKALTKTEIAATWTLTF